MLDYCDACLGPIGPDPWRVTEYHLLENQELQWAFCSEECVLKGLDT